jgi:hypothetical protein
VWVCIVVAGGCGWHHLMHRPGQVSRGFVQLQCAAAYHAGDNGAPCSGGGERAAAACLAGQVSCCFTSSCGCSCMCISDPFQVMCQGSQHAMQSPEP